MLTKYKPDGLMICLPQQAPNNPLVPITTAVDSYTQMLVVVTQQWFDQFEA